MFDSEGIKYTIKSIKNEKGVLICETETTDNVKNQHRTKAIFSFSIGIYEEENNPYDGTVYKSFKPLTMLNNNGYENWGFNLKTNDSKTISPGDEIVLRLDYLFYGYQWDKNSEQAVSSDWSIPEKNLGIINLK
jgi:hypothetical protein